jgi:hypothetical protein
MKPLRIGFLLAASLVVAGCGGDSKAAQPASALHSDSAGGLVIAPSTPYRPTDGEASTALVVNLAGGSTVEAPAPSPACASGEANPETIFWVDGIREGKPLPNERRYTLVNGGCGLEPRLQATVVGGAINVFNDAGVHKLVFVRAGTADTLQTMPFTQSGSVVATDRLTKTAGVVEVKCALHPDERAYIAVFDHPYFGVASSGDKVTLDAIPPGDYRVMTWHEGLAAPAAVPAKVSASGQTEIILR